MLGYCLFALVGALVVFIIGNILLNRPQSELDRKLSAMDAELRRHKQ